MATSIPEPEAPALECFNFFNCDTVDSVVSYDYPAPEGDAVLRPSFELGAAPWASERRLLLIGVQAKTPVREELPPSHYVFLIDNSGSMYAVLPMVKAAMTALAKQLRPGDRVSMVTYGGSVNVLLEGCSDIDLVCRMIDGLAAHGCTPGGEGIRTAYRLAEEHFIKGGNNRIVLITDGDFNVGASSEAAAREDSVAVEPSLEAGENWGWAAAVAEFGLALRNSRFAPAATLEHAAQEAQKHLGDDANGDRAEFLLLARRAAELRRECDAE